MLLVEKGDTKKDNELQTWNKIYVLGFFGTMGYQTSWII